MCGRYSVGKDPVIIHHGFGIQEFQFDEEHFNAAPTQELPVIVAEVVGTGIQARAVKMKWGRPKPGRGPLINARIETADKIFHDAYHHRRCLVPTNGFHEWEKAAAEGLPWRFTSKDSRGWCFAGLWRHDKDTNDDQFVIMTGEPNELVARVHNRMPVIVWPGSYRWWLGEIGFKENRGCSFRDIGASPYPADEMKAYRVRKEVNSVRNDSPECFKPV